MVVSVKIVNVNLFFNVTPKEKRKSNAVKSGERAGQVTKVPMYLSGNC